MTTSSSAPGVSWETAIGAASEADNPTAPPIAIRIACANGVYFFTNFPPFA
jgi:hypothetical protein